MSRLHFVDGALGREAARRRRRAGGPSCRQLADFLEAEIIRIWNARWRAWYAEARGPWIGVGTKRVETRFGLAANTILGSLLLSLDGRFEVDVEHDDEGRPTALVFVRPIGDRVETQVIEIELFPRRIRIGNEHHSLATAQAGAAIIRTVARFAGAFFGSSTA
jgi:hypothetical protein